MAPDRLLAKESAALVRPCHDSRRLDQGHRATIWTGNRRSTLKRCHCDASRLQQAVRSARVSVGMGPMRPLPRLGGRKRRGALSKRRTTGIAAAELQCAASSWLVSPGSRSSKIFRAHAGPRRPIAHSGRSQRGLHLSGRRGRPTLSMHSWRNCCVVVVALLVQSRRGCDYPHWCGRH